MAVSEQLRTRHRPLDSGRELTASPLYRAAAVAAAHTRLLGSVSVIAPPSMWLAVVVALASLVLLAVAAYAVEVPQRVRATGVVMPHGGLRTLAAMQSGRIQTLHVAEGDAVSSGDLLVTITADREMSGTAALQADRLTSLRRENELLDRGERQRETLTASRRAALKSQVRLVTARLSAARQELAAQQQRRSLQQQRLERHESLALRGNLPASSVETARADLLLATAAVAALKQRVAEIELERSRLQEQQLRLVGEHDLDGLSGAAQQERLSREMRDTQSRISEDLHAPEDGVIARVFFSPGTHVRAGQVLLSWHRSGDELEAWLYVPARSAGRLEKGQAIDLRFDAYPAQAFGTQRAWVKSISTTALMPGDLHAPLILREPVFEIRATLEHAGAEVGEKSWSYWTGASFEADIVQHRFRLYEWLTRSIDRGS